jgi:hypothetical protein
MSIHIQRAEPNRASKYVWVIGLLCVIGAYIFQAYTKPRTVYVEATPKFATLYIENDLACEALPCEVVLQNWPKAIWVKSDRYYAQAVPISIFEHFSSERHRYEINLKAFPERPPEPKIILEEKTSSLPQANKAPKRIYSPPPNIVDSKPAVKLPVSCRETEEE